MEIIQFLKQSPETFFARKEIARKARRRDEYEENPHWIDAPLASLLMQGAIEQNDSAAYRVKRRY